MACSVLFVSVGGVFFVLRPETPPPLPMTDSSATGLAILNAVRASLRLVGCSSELLTITQLLTLKDDLRETLAIISAQIESENIGVFSRNFLRSLATHSRFTDDHRVIIDLSSDWESGSKAESEETENGDADPSTVNTAEGKYQPHPSH